MYIHSMVHTHVQYMYLEVLEGCYVVLLVSLCQQDEQVSHQHNVHR